MKKVFLSALAIGALVMTGCKSDEPAGDNQWMQDGEGIGYMSFSISQSDKTRADNPDVTINDETFNKGSENEYAICPNLSSNAAIFFDSDGVFYGMSLLQPSDNNDNGDREYKDEANHVGNNYSDSEQYYTYVTRWRNSDAKAKPSQVIVILNAKPAELEAIANAKTSKADLVAKKYDVFNADGVAQNFGVYPYGDTRYFTMSNSAFLNGSADQSVTQITEAQICATAEKALQNPVTVYVERLLAKFQLTFKTSASTSTELVENGTKVIMDPFNGDTKVNDTPVVNYVENYSGTEDNIDYPNYKSAEWKVYIVNWDINGLEKEGRLIKDISTGSDNYFANWNNFSLHRSYWGASPTYAKNGKAEGFTTQYRDASYDRYPDDKFYGNDMWTAGTHAQLNNLNYISFNNISGRNQFKYAAERTYNAAEGLKNYGPFQYASHYLVGAQLLLQGMDYGDGVTTDVTAGAVQNDGTLANVGDKYYAYSYVFGNVESYIRYSYRRMATWLADGQMHNMNIGDLNSSLQGLTGGYLYKKVGDTYSEISVAEAAEFFTVQPSRTIHGDGKVNIMPIAGKDIYLQISKGNADANFQKLTADDLTCAIYSYTDAAKHFKEGRMYYAIPVQHNQGKSMTASVDRINIDKDNGVYQLGDFGVVRNHWYYLTISKIGSIGIPVDDPDQPIIPDPEDEYYVALEIVVLPWHKINNGEVEL